MIISKKRIAKALIILQMRSLSAPLLFANPEDRFSRVEAHIFVNFLQVLQHNKLTTGISSNSFKHVLSSFL